jgi:protein phosphatase
MAFSFECCAVTHIGNRRKNNEDNFYIGDWLLPEEQSSMLQAGNKLVMKRQLLDGAVNRIFAVSDGMGGHDFGEVASFIVVNALNDFTIGHKMKPSRKRHEKFAYIQAFQELIEQTNHNILEYAAENNANENMGATLSGLIAFSDEVAPVNIGDSSTFLFENSSLRKLTTDDNEASMLKETESSELAGNGKRLTKYFGLPKSSGILTATVSEPVPLKIGQIYVVASDGLTDALTIDDMSNIIGENPSNIETTANHLVDFALNSNDGGRDNITVVMIKTIKTSM